MKYLLERLPYLAWPLVGIGAAGLAVAQTQTPMPAPQTVTFEVPVEITHPAGVQVAVGCVIYAGITRQPIASQVINVPLSLPATASPGATVRDTHVVPVPVHIDGRGVLDAQGWTCQLMRAEGLAWRSGDRGLPNLSPEKILKTAGGMFQ